MVISCSSHINQGPSQISPDNKQCHSGWPWPSPIISPGQVSHNLISKSTQPIVQCCLLIRGSNQSPRPAGRSGESTTSIVSACRSQTPQIKILDDPWPRLFPSGSRSPSQRVSGISPGWRRPPCYCGDHDGSPSSGLTGGVRGRRELTRTRWKATLLY